MQLDPQIIRQSVENLKLVHPELMEDEEAWISALGSETDINELLTRVVRRIEDTKALLVGTEDRLADLKHRCDRFSHRVESLRNLIFKIMGAAELMRIELPEGTLSVRAGQPQLIGDAEPASLPDELCKISRTLDRTKIKDALKAGREVPGFQLSNAQPSLTIRIK